MIETESAKILVVEDENSIREFININLKRNGFDVIEASSGREALKKAGEKEPDVVLLDIMLPDIDGYEVCGKLREQFPELAIIMLTARGQDMDKVMGLELGADDYIVKPFNPLELVARIRAILRRIQKPKSEEKNVISAGPFVLDVNAQRFYKNEQELDMTPREFCLMKTFIENPNKAFNRDEILNMVWGEDFIGDPKTVDVHIRRIREKIEDNPSRPGFIETVWGFGYRWRDLRGDHS